LRDVRGLFRSPAAATLALLWLVGSASLVAFFPREGSPDTAAAPAASSTPPAAAAAAPQGAPATPAPRAMTAAERADFDKWYQAQPRSNLVVPTDGAKVVIVKFNDYQCPPCRLTFMQYKSVLEKFKTTHPGEVKFITKDFPLDPECNTGGPHPAGCEAAAAVRMARLKGKAEALEDWLFANQARMTPELVKEGVRDVAGVTDFDARYQAVLDQVRADIKYGHSLGVNRTPTFFINGRKIEGGLEPQFFEAAIESELASAKSSAKP
jgi:protein-disulfide isomerase